MSSNFVNSSVALKLACVLILTSWTPSVLGADKEPEKSLRTYLLLGQSNMVGWGDYSSLDQEWTMDLEQDSRIHFCSKDTEWKVASLTHAQRAVDKPYKVNGTFGPEFSFIDAVRQKYPNEDVLFLKHAVGGTTLHAAWDKQWSLEKARMVKDEIVEKRRHHAGNNLANRPR